jgi:hypothetical protein
VKKATGATTLAEKREMSMWGLIIASGVCGLLFGRYFKMYALIPATLVLAGIAYFFANRRALFGVGHGCHAVVLLPFGCDHYFYG